MAGLLKRMGKCQVSGQGSYQAQAKYAGLRGTYDLDGPGFKGDATGSDKNTGFSLPHDAYAMIFGESDFEFAQFFVFSQRVGAHLVRKKRCGIARRGFQ